VVPQNPRMVDDDGRGVAALVTGPLGSGKTSVAAEVGALLEHRGLSNAVIDLDWLCWVGLGITDERLEAVLHDNLRAVVARYRLEGVTRFLLARTVQSTNEVASLRDAVAPAAVAVVRLEVSAHVAEQRVRLRAPHDSLMTDHDLAEQSELWTAASLLDADVVVDNEAGTLSEVAAQVLASLVSADGRWADGPWVDRQLAIPGGE